jgi:hypothetical protein
MLTFHEKDKFEKQRQRLRLSTFGVVVSDEYNRTNLRYYLNQW